MKETKDMIGTRLKLGLPFTSAITLGKNIGTRLHLNLPPTEPITFVSDNSKPKVLSKTKKRKQIKKVL